MQAQPYVDYGISTYKYLLGDGTLSGTYEALDINASISARILILKDR